MTPHLLYIRYLATLNYDYSQMCEHFTELNLAEPDVDVYSNEVMLIEEKLPASVRTQIEKRKYSAGFLKWMEILEVKKFWRCAKATRTLVLDIHQDPHVRLAINALLLKGMPVGELTQSLNIKFATTLTEEVLELYKFFFFNIPRMTRTAWKVYLRKCEPHEQKIYFMAFTSPLEVVKTEFELPAKISVSNTLQYLLSKSFEKAKTSLAHDHPESGKEARAWIKQVAELADKYEKHRVSDASDFSQTLQMEFEYVDQEFPSPDPETLAELEEQTKNREDEKHEVEEESPEK